MRKHNIHTKARKCVRCKEPIFNPFRQTPWCSDCQIDLQAMSFNGEEVLEMVLAMMPPQPPHPQMAVRVMTVLSVCRRVLVKNGLLGDDEDDEEQNSPGKKLLKVS